MNLIYWIILFVIFPPVAILLMGVKLAGKLLKIMIYSYLVAFVLLAMYVILTVCI